MPFDGGFLHKMSQELSGFVGAKIDKISQPTREILILALRHQAGSKKLLLSASSAAPKIHFTESALENPKSAPMFCMLLRKRLGGGRLTKVEQLGLDRVLTLTFDCINELGDRVALSLVCEIMGRHSNIILVDETGRIVDAARRVDFVASEVRQVLPGLPYEPPPAQGKENLLERGPNALADAVLAGRDLPLSKALLERLEGLSPMVCREVSYLVCGAEDTVVSQLGPAEAARLRSCLGAVADALSPGGGSPCLIRDAGGRAADYTYLEPRQFPADWRVETFESYSALIDSFYTGRDTADEMRRKSQQLHKHLVTLRDRLRRKLLAQNEDLQTSAGRETYKQYGDIISANLYAMKKGDSALVAVNFFDPDQPEVTIPLDIMLTPVKNAQKYYSDYRKAATAEEKLRELLAQGVTELAYLESVLSQLERVATTDELEGIREELVSQRLLKKPGQKSGKPLRLPPLKFLSSDGYLILCGRNNLQNDQLTLREARGSDLWLHTQGIHGSHVIVERKGQEDIPNTTIEEAAVIAACHSAAGEGAKVAVDYTPVKFVKKPKGGRPGMVVYETYQTAMVAADRKRADALRCP